MKKLRVSLILNIVIVVLVIFGLIIMLTGFQFMGYEKRLSATRIEAFRFFTVDSNVLAGIVSACMAVYEIRALKGLRQDIPKAVYAFKLIAAVGIGLTFFTVALFLAPGVEDGYFSLFKNSNLFFHLLVPLAGMISFAFFEGTDKLRFPVVFAGMIPMVIYGIFYSVNLIVHMEGGTVSGKYDWYNFLAGGIQTAPVVILIIFAMTFLISWLLWLINRKIYKRSIK